MWKRAPRWLVDSGIALFAILPLLLTAHIPETDLPNHLARQTILRDLPSSPVLQQFYVVHWQVLANLGLEVFVFAARHFMSIDLALRLFCIITVLLLFFGVKIVNLKCGGIYLYRFVALLCYGGPVQFGFLSFCFGIGLGLVLFGLWLRMRTSALLLQIAVFAPAAFALLLCHLAAFGLFALACGGYEFGRAVSTQPLRARSAVLAELRLAAWIAPSFGLFLLLTPPGGRVGAVVYSGLMQKLEGVAAITLFSAPGVELPLLLAAVLGFGMALMTGVVRLRAEGLSIILLQTAVWLLLPRAALSGGFIDYRVPWAISLWCLATLAVGPRVARSRATPVLAATFAVLTLIRVGSVAALWLSWEPIIAGIDAALSRLSPGSRLWVVLGANPSTSAGRSPELTHMAAYAVARRQAFEPQMFASISGQVLYFTPSFYVPWMPIPSTLARVPGGYDTVLILAPQFATIAPGLPLECIAHGQDFELFRVQTGGGTMPCPASEGLAP